MSRASAYRKWGYILAAAAAYGLANYLSGKKYLPGCSFAELRPQICMPIFAGIAWGPLAGFFVGAIGDSTGYLLAGVNPLPLWYWSVANGLMGGIPGMMYRTAKRHLAGLNDIKRLYVLLILASSLPYVFAAAMECLIKGAPWKATFQFVFLPIFTTDALFAIILIPAFLLLTGRVRMTIPTSLFILSTYLASMVALCTFAASMVAIWGRNALSEMAAAHLYSMGIMTLLSILIGFALAAFFVKRMTEPIMALTQAADRIADEQYGELAQLDTLARRRDELGQLASAFRQMAAKIHSREERLKTEVRRLHIEIDEARQRREVERITGSDYFKSLKNRAAQMRLMDKQHG